MIFRQLFDPEGSSTYTYIIGDEISKEAIIIDPVIEFVDRDRKILDELGLKLLFAINTHVHADHITGSGKLKQLFEGCKSGLGAKGNEKALADKKFLESEVLYIGKDKKISLRFLHTPGHTAGCHSLLLEFEENGKKKMYVFTGDTVLIRGCGRTDFQGGSSEQLYESVMTKIFTLPDDTFIYPAHDYKGWTVSTVGEEKKYNPRLTKSLQEFKEIMSNLNLPYPKKIDASLPANLKCGLQD